MQQAQDAQPRALGEGSVVRSVRFPVAPLPDESWPGYLARTTSWNGLKRTGILLQEAGAPPQVDLGHSAQSHLPSLVAILKAKEGELRRMLILDDASEDSSYYFGLKFKRSRFLRSIRRVSPRALRTSAHHRAAWLIDVLPYCAEGWDLLIDRCPSKRCGARLRWRDSVGIDFCEHCGYDLKEAPSRRVQRTDRPALELLAALVSPDETRRQSALGRVPAPFNALNAAALFELIIWFSRALVVARKDRRAPECDLTAPRLAAGTQLVLDYPDSFQKLVGYADDNGEALERRSRFFGYLSPLARAHHYEKDVARFLAKFLAEHGQALRGRHLLTDCRQRREEMTVGLAAASLGIENADVRKLINHGLLEPSYEHGRERKSAWLCSDQVARVGAVLRGRVSAVEFGKANGLPIEGVEQLIGLGLLRVASDPVLSALYSGIQLRRDSASIFLERLEEAVWRPRSFSSPVALSDAFMAIGGAKPWGRVLKAALDGELPEPLAMELGASLKIDQLTMSTEFSQALAAGCYPHLLLIPKHPSDLGPAPGFSRSEVERYFNCYPRDITWLRVNGHLTDSGRGGRCFERTQVERLGRALISSREISWRWRVSPERREALPIEYGIQRALGPFWPRAKVTEHFSRL